MKKFLKNILTNYVFKFLFEKSLNIKDGDILRCDDDLFIFDNSNGNPNSLKKYYKINGFWNYIKAKNGSVYNMTKKQFVDKICQGYDGLEYYKNGIYVATENEIKLYKNLKI